MSLLLFLGNLLSSSARSWVFLNPTFFWSGKKVLPGINSCRFLSWLEKCRSLLAGRIEQIYFPSRSLTALENRDYFMESARVRFSCIHEPYGTKQGVNKNCTKHFPWCFPFIICILRHLSFCNILANFIQTIAKIFWTSWKITESSPLGCFHFLSVSIQVLSFWTEATGEEFRVFI